MKNKKIICILILCMMINNNIVITNALEISPFNDIEGHWAEELLVKKYKEGIINGYPDGSFKPNNNLTRAELITVVNSSFGLNDRSDDLFVDMSGNEWYISESQKAIYYDYVDEIKLDGDSKATRIDAITMIGNLLKLQTEEFEPNFDDLSSLDRDEVYMLEAFAQLGYIQGDENGNLNPEDFLRRAELITIIDNILGYVVYSQEDVENIKEDSRVTIIADDIIVKDKIIKELYISPGVSKGIVIEDTIISEKLIIDGEGDVGLIGSDIEKIVSKGSNTVNTDQDTQIGIIDAPSPIIIIGDGRADEIIYKDVDAIIDIEVGEVPETDDEDDQDDDDDNNTSKKKNTTNRDTLAPTIESTNFGDEQKILQEDNLIIVFNESISNSNISDLMEVVDEDGNILNGEFTISDDKKTVTFAHTVDFASGMGYRVIVKAGLSDSIGNETTSDIETTFTAADYMAPVISLIYPRDQYKIYPSDEIIGQFDEVIKNTDGLSIDNPADYIKITDMSHNVEFTDFTSVLSIEDGKTIIRTRANSENLFIEKSIYKMELFGAVQDESGNVRLATSSDFSEFAIADVTKPVVTNVTTTNGNTGVSTDSDLVIVFSEPIEINQAKEMILLKLGEEVEYDLGNPQINEDKTKITIDIDNNLDINADYQVSLPEGYVEDTWGNTNEEDSSGKFDTHTPIVKFSVDNLDQNVSNSEELSMTFTPEVLITTGSGLRLNVFLLKKYIEDTDSWEDVEFTVDVNSTGLETISTFNLTENMEEATRYRMGTKTEVESLGGMALAPATYIEFTSFDDTPPVVEIMLTDLSDTATNTYSNINIQFDEEIGKIKATGERITDDNVNDIITIYEIDSDGNEVDVNMDKQIDKNDIPFSATLSSDRKNILVNPTYDFRYYRNYRVVLDIVTDDSDSENSLSEEEVKDFTIGGLMIVDDKYEIISIESLLSIGDDPSLVYELARSIDFNEEDSYQDSESTIYGDLNGDGIVESIKDELTTGLGFMPIETLTTGKIYDTSRSTITNLYINRPDEDNIGLFKTIEKDARIFSLRIIDASITGRDNVGIVVGENFGIVRSLSITGDNIVNGREKIGGVVGNNEGTISSIPVSVTVLATGDYAGGVTGYSTGGLHGDRFISGTITGQNYVGGLVGYMENQSIDSNEAIYQSSSSSGTINGNNYVGGLVGSLKITEESSDVNHTMLHSFSDGSVNGNDYVGGLAGNIEANYLEVSTSYSTSTIIGNENVGGLIGKYIGEIVNDKTPKIMTSYFAGNITANKNVGGIIGDAGTVEIELVYASGNIQSENTIINAGGIIGNLSDIANLDRVIGKVDSSGVSPVVGNGEISHVGLYENVYSSVEQLGISTGSQVSLENESIYPNKFLYDYTETVIKDGLVNDYSPFMKSLTLDRPVLASRFELNNGLENTSLTEME